MTIEEAIANNPYNNKVGNLSAYCRYLRYNVDGIYNKTNAEVKQEYLKAVKGGDNYGLS